MNRINTQSGPYVRDQRTSTAAAYHTWDKEDLNGPSQCQPIVAVKNDSTMPDTQLYPDETAASVHHAMISACSSLSPFRDVDWRYRRAKSLHEGHLKYRPRREDLWVRLALAQIRGERIRGKDAQSRWTAAAEAYSLRFTARSHLRWELEARLLAGQTDDEIAARLGLESSVVDAFERLFFHVRERLDKTDYIMLVVIGPSVYEGLQPDDCGVISKLYGYLFGPIALDYVLRYLKFPGVPVPDGTPLGFEVAFAHRLSLAIAARSLRVDADEALKIVRVGQHMDEIERVRASRDHTILMASIPPTDAQLPLLAVGDRPAEATGGRSEEQPSSIRGKLPVVIPGIDVDTATDLSVRATG